MKAAREIIAKSMSAGRACSGQYPCTFCSWSPDEMNPNLDETGCDWIANAILAALAAEGLSIVETEPNPVEIEAVAYAIAEVIAKRRCDRTPAVQDQRRIEARAAIRALDLSRSTRQGKTG